MFKLAIVGRPNVGKSALFNRIARRRIAVVHEEEGVTRDRLYAKCECFGHHFELIDTGGIDFEGKIPFCDEVRIQAQIAASEADVILLVVDGRIGPTHQDHEVVRVLREYDKPILLVVNKIDSSEQESLIGHFYELGVGEPYAVSAVQGHLMAEMLEAALAHCPKDGAPEEDPAIRVALVGRPNVGKSMMLNQLLDDQRSIVSETAGTTRDPIDARLVVDNQEFVLIDTAGIRRKFKERAVVEKFASMRTQMAIERADVCVLMIDATEGLTREEKKILGQIEEAGKGCVLVMNKWDLVKETRMEHCRKALYDDASFVAHCPVIFTSALKGRNCEAMLKEVRVVAEQMDRRITTGQLNKCITKAMQLYHPPLIRGKRLRVYYLTQIKSHPPHFVLFVNHPDRMLDSYQRYLLNALRKEYRFTGCPVRLTLRKHSQRSDINEYVASRS